MTFIEEKIKQFRKEFPALYFHENKSLDPMRQADITDVVEDFLTTAMQEAQAEERKKAITIVENARLLINSFQALMTTETTDGSKGQTFMALPQKLTNQSINIIIKKLT